MRRQWDTQYLGLSVSRNIAVGVASVLLIGPNPWRKKIIFVNDAANPIYLSRGMPAVVNTGIRLNAQGGAIVDQPDQIGYLWRGEWYGISSVAAQNLAISEDS